MDKEFKDLIEAIETLDEAKHAVRLLDRIEGVSKSLQRWTGASTAFTAVATAFPIIFNNVTLTNFTAGIVTSTVLTGYATYVSRKKRSELRSQFKDFEKSAKPAIRDELRPFKNILNNHTDHVENLFSQTDFDMRDPHKARSVPLVAISVIAVPFMTPMFHFLTTNLRECFDNARTAMASSKVKNNIQRQLKEMNVMNGPE